MSSVKQFFDAKKLLLKDFDARIKKGPFLGFSDDDLILFLPNTEFLLTCDTLTRASAVRLYRTEESDLYQLIGSLEDLPLIFIFDPDHYDLPERLPDGRYKIILWMSEAYFGSKPCYLRTVESLPDTDFKH